MKKNNLQRPNLHFRAANVFDLSQLREAIKPFNGEPFDVSCEGLLVYFNDDEKRFAATNIYKLMAENNGTFVTSDIFDRETSGKIMGSLGKDYLQVLQRCLQSMVKATGRNMRENFFESQEAAEKLFGGIGFKFEKTPVYDGSYEVTALNKIPDKDFGTKLTNSFTQRQIWSMKAS